MQQQLGETIREYRNRKGYTMNELANKLDISIGLLSNIETGKTDSFQLNLLNSIINKLDIPLSELRLFSKPYSITSSDVDVIKDFSKISSSLDAVIEAFIETSSTLSFNLDRIASLSTMLVKELHTINKLIKATKSK